MQIANSGNCAIQISATMAGHDWKKDNELSTSDWEGIMVEDFDRLYRIL